MNRLSRVAVLLTVALGVLLQGSPVPALADQIGGVIVIPGSGTDLASIRLRTSGGCPAKADAYYATMKGHGFPPDGQIVTSNISAGLSHSFGFDVYVAQIMRDYAAQNHTTLSGRYDITVLCIDSFTANSFGEFTGAMDFTSPTTFQAIGAAKPNGPPPTPLALAGDGSALAPDMPAPTPPRTRAPTAASPPNSTDGQPLLPTTHQPVPNRDPPPSPGTEQLTSQGHTTTGQRIPWPILGGAALIILIIAAEVIRRVRKRRAT